MAADVGVEANVNPPVGRDWLADDLGAAWAGSTSQRKAPTAINIPSTAEKATCKNTMLAFEREESRMR